MLVSLAFSGLVPTVAHGQGAIEKKTYFFKEANKEMERNRGSGYTQ